MGKKWEKFLLKIQPSLNKKLLPVVWKILRGDLESLDIVKLQWYDNRYRCRVGQVRIIFDHTLDHTIIIDIDFRWNVY